MDSGASFSFNEWFRGARPRLLRLAQSRVRDLGLAEDVVQETALAVWRRHAQGGVDNLDAYANRAVWRNAIRLKTRRRDFEPLEAAEWEGAAGAPPGAEEWLEAMELQEAIAGLPPAQAAAVRLRFFADMSFVEMAESLSIGLNTAASRTRYALAALKKILGAAGHGPSVPQPPPPRAGAQQEEHHGKRKRSKGKRPQGRLAPSR